MSAKVTAILGLEFQDNATAKLQEASNNFKKTTEETAKSINLDFKSIALGASSTAVGIVSLATSFNSLDKSALAASRAVTASQQAQLTFEKSQRRVNELLKDGRGGTEEYRIAVEEMNIAHDKVGLASEKARLAQDAYNDKVLTFAVGIAPQMISIGLGVQTVLKGIGITSLAQIPAVLGYGAAHTTAMGAITTSTTVATGATNAFRLASIAAFLTNPIGIAIIGITTLVTLLATNAFGLRDAFANLGKMIFDFLNQHLKPLADLLGFLNEKVIQPIAKALNPTLKDSAEQAGRGMDTATRSADSLSEALQPNLSRSIQEVKSGLTLLTSVTSKWSEQSKNLQDITFGTTLTMRNQIQTIQLTASEVKKLNEEYEKSIEKNDSLTEALKRNVEWHESLKKHFEEARAKAFGASQGNIDASRFQSDQFARLMQDQITSSGGLTPQEFSSALLLSGVSAGQENAAIWSSQKFLNAVAEIRRGKAFNTAFSKLSELGIGIPQEFRDTFLPNRSRGDKAGGTDVLTIATAQRTDSQLFQNAVIALANKIGQGVTEDQIKMIVREVVTQVLNGMEGR